jgi:hypothetical protein
MSHPFESNTVEHGVCTSSDGYFHAGGTWDGRNRLSVAGPRHPAGDLERWACAAEFAIELLGASPATRIACGPMSATTWSYRTSASSSSYPLRLLTTVTCALAANKPA